MTTDEWRALCDEVTDAMKEHTRPFVTPLVHEPADEPVRVGSGSYVDLGSAHLLTCEHVTRYQPQQHRPYGGVLQQLNGARHEDPAPIDASLTKLDQTLWPTIAADAKLIPSSRFAKTHAPVEHELLFFRGVADENTYVGFGAADFVTTGYCSQEKPGSGDKDLFEILWEPEKTQVTSGTDNEVRSRVRYENAHGMSGSLVWNTRFVESGLDPSRWRPSMAQVTGLLRRWDTSTRTLLVWRVEHLNAWLNRVLP